MARTTDRQHISEAIRKQTLWHVTARFHSGVVLETGYDERLSIGYGVTGRVKYATYRHWDRDSGETVSLEEITQGKRKCVLHLISQKNVGE